MSTNEVGMNWQVSFYRTPSLDVQMLSERFFVPPTASQSIPSE
jgi:hypothetical protein